jgi:hypothetical protein
MRQWRVGTFSMGIILIALGAVMLVSQLKGVSAFAMILRWWPVILIMLGVEILIYILLSRQEQPKVKFDVFSILIVVFIMIFSIGAYSISGAISMFNGGSVFFEGFNIYKYQSRFKKEYTIETKGRDKLTVVNSYGNVEVIKGDSENIEVEANITIRNNDEEYAAQISDSIVDITGTDSIKISTKSAQYMNDRNKANNISVNYFIKVPEKMNVKIDNKFADVSIDGIQLSADVENPHGNTVVKEIGGDVNIESSFGDVSAESVTGKADINMKHGRMSVKGIEGDLNAINSFGDIVISDVKGNVVLNNSNGYIKAGRIEGNFIVESKFCKMDLFDIKGNAGIEGGNGDISLEGAGGDVKVVNSFGRIDVINAVNNIDLKGGNGDITLKSESKIGKDVSIDNKFGNIYINVPKDQNGYFDLKTSFGTIKSEFDMEAKKEANKESFTGTVISDDVKFTIDNGNGDIIIEKN